MNNNDQRPSTELQEKDFINQGYKQNPYPAWLWLFIVAVLIAISSSLSNWYTQFMKNSKDANPFLQVSNRDFSLFLWQNPSLMRVNAAQSKSAYLTGFQYLEKVNILPGQAEEYVVAPPEVIFLYHVWQRLLGQEPVVREIAPVDFAAFLRYADEWQPKNWPEAPKGYAEVVNGLADNKVLDLNLLPEGVLPLAVRQAFQGWKNYMSEGDKINALRPTFEKMQAFLKEHPHYMRPYWKNIVQENYPRYLKEISTGQSNPEDVLPKDEIAPFLQVAFYNAQLEPKAR